MKIKGVIIKDAESGKLTAFIRQFPGICAQGDSVQEVDTKLNAYFKAFIERIKNEEVDIDESQIASM